MILTYDPRTRIDVLRWTLKKAAIATSSREIADLIVDFDEDGHVVAIEVLQASQRADNPEELAYLVDRITMHPLHPNNNP